MVIGKKSRLCSLIEIQLLQKKTSAHATVWNRLTKMIIGKYNTAKEFRGRASMNKALLYPTFDHWWFGCAERVEKLSELRDSYWITLKQSSRLSKNAKVMLFIHGGGFISGHPLGLESQSVMHALNDFNKKHHACSHVLSVNYRLLTEPSEYDTMDRRLFTDRMGDQVEDCFDCFNYLIHEKKIPASNIVIAGYSAGAALSMLLVLKRLLKNYKENEDSNMYWPVHSVSLYSVPGDISDTIVVPNLEEIARNTLVLSSELLDVIHRCVPKDDLIPFSVACNLEEMKKDENFAKQLFMTKWAINYSNHEELTPGNEYLVKELEILKKQVPSASLLVVTEDHQMHCYTAAYGWLPEARRSMFLMLEQALK